MVVQAPIRYDVTIAHISNSWNWYDGDSIIWDVQIMDNRPILYDNGCRINGNVSHHDCTAACLDPQDGWRDTSFTLYNCMVRTLGTELALLMLSIVLLQDYGPLLVHTGYLALDDRAWALGQIIAVTIWLPVLVKFVWDTVEGGDGDHRKRGTASSPWTTSYKISPSGDPEESGVVLPSV
jgi:hypothetical protein